MELLLIYALGAELYGAIEILWRGRTHWTMLLCGGVCFTIMYLISAAALKVGLSEAFVSGKILGQGLHLKGAVYAVWAGYKAYAQILH